jgi:excisionase family DNA binding protein
MDQLLVTIDEAAQALSVSRRTLYRLIEAGEIDAVRIGSSRRVPTAALQTFCTRAVREARIERIGDLS